MITFALPNFKLMEQLTAKRSAVYEAPESRVILVKLNNVMCLSDRGNSLNKLEGEEW